MLLRPIIKILITLHNMRYDKYHPKNQQIHVVHHPRQATEWRQKVAAVLEVLAIVSSQVQISFRLLVIIENVPPPWTNWTDKNLPPVLGPTMYRNKREPLGKSRVRLGTVS